MLITQEQILRETSSYKARLRDEKYRAEPLQKALQDRIALIRGQSLASISLDAYSLLHTLDWALSQPELTDPNLLAAYLTELIRLMENVGAGLDFREAIDRAISFYQTTRQSTVDLYLAKVEYLRLTDTESSEKEEALRAASGIVQSPEESIKVLLKLVQYYIDSSQYDRAIETCLECENLTSDHDELQGYLPKVLDLLGITYFYLFDYESAKVHLLKACEFGRICQDNHTLGEALHYLGRVAFIQGDPVQAMQHYIHGSRYQRDNLADKAWYHLRMGELLVAANLMDEARDHLAETQRLFSRIEYNGSALVQVEWAWADIYKAEKKYDLAEKHIERAMEFAIATKFPRGELASLVKLFWLQLLHRRHVHKAVYILCVAMTKGEIRRHNSLKLLLYYISQVLLIPYKWLTGSSYSVFGATNLNITVEKCICPMHTADQN